MEIKFDLGDNLPLYKAIEILNVYCHLLGLLLGLFFNENNKYCPQVLEECL